MNDILGFLLPLAIFILIFYFLLVKPQKKAAEKRSAMLQSIKAGDKIVTISHVIAEVITVEGDELLINIADRGNCEIRIHREGVSHILNGDAISSNPEAK